MRGRIQAERHLRGHRIRLLPTIVATSGHLRLGRSVQSRWRPLKRRGFADVRAVNVAASNAPSSRITQSGLGWGSDPGMRTVQRNEILTSGTGLRASHASSLIGDARNEVALDASSALATAKIKIAEPLQDEQKFRPSEASAQNNCDLLFRNDRLVVTNIAMRNVPLLTTDKRLIHNTAFSPSALLASYSLDIHLSGQRHFHVADFDGAPPNGNMAIIGGQATNPNTQIILGTGEISPLFSLFRNQKPGTGPRVRGDMSKYINRGPLESEPPFPLIIDERQEQYEGEYMLLTSIPDPFEPQFRIISIMGQHRAGAMAIKYLLSDQKLIERIRKETRHMEAFQLLFPVDTVDVNGYAVPTGIQEFQRFEIYNTCELNDSLIPDGIDDFNSVLRHLEKDTHIIQMFQKTGEPPNEERGSLLEALRGQAELHDIESFFNKSEIEIRSESLRKFLEFGNNSLYLGPDEGSRLRLKRPEKTDDAKLKRLADEFIREAGGIANAANWLFGQASPEESAQIKAGMANRELKSRFVIPKTITTTAAAEVTTPTAPPTLSDSELAEFNAYATAEENRWRGRASKMSPSEFIKTKYATWLGRGLSREHIAEVQCTLAGAYAAEISASRHPERRITNLIERPYRLPANAPRPPSKKRVAELSEEESLARNEKAKGYTQAWRRRRQSPQM